MQNITTITATLDDGSTVVLFPVAAVPAPVAPEVIEVPLDTPVELEAAPATE